MDWGKHRFEANKKAREARKKETRIVVKQVKLRPNINEHDLETKLKHAARFLQAGDKVKVTIMFRGREVIHKDIAIKRQFEAGEADIDPETRKQLEALGYFGE